MEDFSPGRRPARGAARGRDLLDPTALTVTGRPLVDYLDDAADLGPRGHPAARRAAAAATPGSPCSTATSPPTAPSSSRPRPRRTCCSTAAGRVVFDSVEDLHARIDDPDLDVDADSVLVLRGCGPEGLPGHARGGQPAAAGQAAAAGRPRHGADLRRPDERHRVRHRRAARRARGRGRRPARPGPHRRLDRPRRRAAAGSTSTSRPRSSPRGAPPAAAVAAFARRPAAGSGSTSHGAAGQHRRRPRLPGRLERLGSRASRTDGSGLPRQGPPRQLSMR